MVDIILDTSVWITNVAADEPKGVFNELVELFENSEINLLSNNIILEEWERNKERILVLIRKSIKDDFTSAKNITTYLEIEDSKAYSDLLRKYSSEDIRIEEENKRFEAITDIIKRATQTIITDEMKLQVVDWAIEKKAPFMIKKNSVADALILLSSIEHRNNYGGGMRPKGIFITMNHTDYADPEDKDLPHPDLEEMLDGADITYVRHLNQALFTLAPAAIMDFENWIDIATEMYREERRGF